MREAFYRAEIAYLAVETTLGGKIISVNERNLTSENWTVYNEATKRLQYSTAPTSAITAETVTVGGFVFSQKETEKITGYQSNALNQHAMLSVDDIADFIPSYDAENRPTDFTSQAVDGTITTVHYDWRAVAVGSLVIVAGISIVVATIAEDVGTGGVGITNDIPSFSAAGSLIARGASIIKSAPRFSPALKPALTY